MTEPIYFNIFYSVMALLALVVLMGALAWLIKVLDRSTTWLWRLVFPKKSNTDDTDALNLSEIKALLAKNGSQALVKHGSYQEKLARLALENSRFRKSIDERDAVIAERDAKLKALDQELCKLRETQDKLQKATLHMQDELMAQSSSASDLSERLKARTMELDAIAEAYAALVKSHDGELKDLFSMLDRHHLDDANLKRGRTYFKNEIKMMRKLLIDLESAAGKLSPYPSRTTEITKPEPSKVPVHRLEKPLSVSLTGQPAQ